MLALSPDVGISLLYYQNTRVNVIITVKAKQKKILSCHCVCRHRRLFDNFGVLCSAVVFDLFLPAVALNTALNTILTIHGIL